MLTQNGASFLPFSGSYQAPLHDHHLVPLCHHYACGVAMKKLLALHKWPSLSLSVRQIRVLVLLFALAVCAAGLAAAGVMVHYRLQAAINVYDASFVLNARAASSRLMRHQALLQRTQQALADPPGLVSQNEFFWLQRAGVSGSGSEEVSTRAQALAFAWRQLGAIDADDGNAWLLNTGAQDVYLIPQNAAQARIQLDHPGLRTTVVAGITHQFAAAGLLTQLAAQPRQTLVLAPAADPLSGEPVLRLATLLQPRSDRPAGSAPMVLALDLPVRSIAPPSALFGADLGLVLQRGGELLSASPPSIALQRILQLLQSRHTRLDTHTQWQLVRDGGMRFSVLFVRPLGVPGWYAVARVGGGQIWQDIAQGTLLLAAACAALMAALLCWAWLVDRRILRPTEQQSQRIQESESLNQGVFQTAPVGLMVVGLAQGDLLKINDLARAFWADAGAAERDFLIAHCQHLAQATGQLDATLHFATTVAGQGGLRNLQVRLIEMRVANSPALLITLDDDTDTHAAERRMKQLLAETAKANRAKSEFLATMSHEIRTPLNGMLGGVELLAMTPLDIEQQDRLEVIRRSSAALITTLNDVLDFSKIEAGEMQVRPHPAPLLALIENIARNFAPLASHKGIALHCLIAPELPAEVNIDAGRVEQVLGNLLSNAIKFTSQGRVTLAVTRVPGVPALEIKVCDTGPGISTEDQPLLFEPFVQAEQTDTRRFEGTGLGLSICKRLVMLMEGSIQLSSELGSGSCFTVHLPFTTQADTALVLPDLAGITVQLVLSAEPMQYEMGRWLRASGASVLEGVAPHPAAILLSDEAGLVIYAQTQPPQTCIVLQQEGPLHARALTSPVYFSSVARLALLDLLLQLSRPDALLAAPAAPADFALPFSLRILLVEDHEVNQIVMRKQLQHLGQQVDVVSNGEEALAQLARGSYQLVMTDIQMPRMDGYELARRMREQGYQMPMAALSARVFQDESQRCAAVGIAWYLSKPLRTDQLAQLLQQVVQSLPAYADDAATAYGGPDNTALAHANDGLPDAVISKALRADMQALSMAYEADDLMAWQNRLHALSGALAVLDYPVEARHCRDMELGATSACLARQEDWEELKNMLTDILG